MFSARLVYSSLLYVLRDDVTRSTLTVFPAIRAPSRRMAKPQSRAA